MATVVKNFRIKSGLIVEGTTGTINGQNILTETGSDSYILNLVGGATLVKSVESTQLEVNGAGKLSVKSGVFDASGAAAAAQTAAEATASADATSKANSAQSAAITAAATDATTKVAAEAALRVSGDAASVSTAAADATTKADAAQAAAISAAAADATTKANAAKAGAEATAAAALSSAISTEVTDRNSAIATAKGEATAYTNSAVSNLVGLAPQSLDTIHELATALENNPDIIANLESVAAGKQDALTAGMGIEIDGTTIGVAFDAGNGLAINGTNLTIDTNVISTKAYAEGVADDAQTAAESYAAGLISTEVTGRNTAISDAISAEVTNRDGAIESAVNNLVDGTTSFNTVNVGDVSSQSAAQLSNIQGASIVTGFDSAVYKTGKATVKVSNGTHTQVSEILVTLDSSNNVALTEYAIVTSNGSLADVTAEYKSSTGFTNIWVSPLNGYTVSATVILNAIK